jgi:hypothetical protein
MQKRGTQKLVPSSDDDFKFSERSLKPRYERTTICEAADGGLRVCASKQAVMAGRCCRNHAVHRMRLGSCSVGRPGGNASRGALTDEVYASLMRCAMLLVSRLFSNPGKKE